MLQLKRIFFAFPLASSTNPVISATPKYAPPKSPAGDQGAEIKEARNSMIAKNFDYFEQNLTKNITHEEIPAYHPHEFLPRLMA